MNNSSIVTNFSTEKVSNTAEFSGPGKPLVLQLLFGLISLMAFGGNGVFCVVIMRHRRLKRSPYHLLIFSLAFTDMLTGKPNKQHLKQGYPTFSVFPDSFTAF